MEMKTVTRLAAALVISGCHCEGQTTQPQPKSVLAGYSREVIDHAVWLQLEPILPVGGRRTGFTSEQLGYQGRVIDAYRNWAIKLSDHKLRDEYLDVLKIIADELVFAWNELLHGPSAAELAKRAREEQRQKAASAELLTKLPPLPEVKP